MMMEIFANLIFKVKIEKNVFNKFCHFLSINIDVGKKYFSQHSKRMKRYIFDVLCIFALKPLFFEKHGIFKQKNCQNGLMVQFRIGESSDFHQTPYIYVFLRVDYVYNSENFRLVDFHGETIKKP